jgi:hypothetical protein
MMSLSPSSPRRRVLSMWHSRRRSLKSRTAKLRRTGSSGVAAWRQASWRCGPMTVRPRGLRTHLARSLVTGSQPRLHSLRPRSRSGPVSERAGPLGSRPGLWSLLARGESQTSRSRLGNHGRDVQPSAAATTVLRRDGASRCTLWLEQGASRCTLRLTV